MRPDLDPHVVDMLARTHERQVRDTQKLYGQRNGIDQPSYDDNDFPFAGFMDALGDIVGRVFDVFIIALVLIMVIGLTLSQGPTP